MVALADLFDPERLANLVTDGFVACRRHPTEPLRLYDYTPRAQYERCWTAEQLVGPLPWHEPFDVFDKVDGSLGILYTEPVSGRMAVSTRGSFASEQALRATTVLRARYPEVTALPSEQTWLVEIIYPGNRIVVDYRDLELRGRFDAVLAECRADLADPQVDRLDRRATAAFLQTRPHAAVLFKLLDDRDRLRSSGASSGRPSPSCFASTPRHDERRGLLVMVWWGSRLWWMWVWWWVSMMVLSGSVLSCEEFFVNDFGRKLAASYVTMVTRLRERQEGATAAEYALLVALISVVIIGTVTLLGAQIKTAFEKVETAIAGANGA